MPAAAAEHPRPGRPHRRLHTTGKDSPAREPSWLAFWLHKPSILRVCVREDETGRSTHAGTSVTASWAGDWQPRRRLTRVLSRWGPIGTGSLAIFSLSRDHVTTAPRRQARGGHVACINESALRFGSSASPYPEPLRVTGPLPSLVLRAEDMWRRHNQCLEIEVQPVTGNWIAMETYDGPAWGLATEGRKLTMQAGQGARRSGIQVDRLYSSGTPCALCSVWRAGLSDAPWLNRRRPGSLYSIIEYESSSSSSSSSSSGVENREKK